MSTLTVHGLGAGYAGRQVLDGIGLPPLASGELVALVGPNAAGKSTLLRAIARLTPATGDLRLDDTDLFALSPSELVGRVGFMPQDLRADARLTVLETVIVALSAGGGRREGADERAAAVLERLGIGSLAMRPVDALSGGQRQLAGLAQAVARGGAVLLLDEPTSALDLGHQWQVMSTIRELARAGRIVLAVLHDLSLAARWADRVIVLAGGRVVAVGPPAEAITTTLLRDVYRVRGAVIDDGAGGHLIRIDGPADPRAFPTPAKGSR